MFQKRHIFVVVDKPFWISQAECLSSVGGKILESNPELRDGWAMGTVLIFQRAYSPWMYGSNYVIG